MNSVMRGAALRGRDAQRHAASAAKGGLDMEGSYGWQSLYPESPNKGKILALCV
jgi:hypothetical protein